MSTDHVVAGGAHKWLQVKESRRHVYASSRRALITMPSSAALRAQREKTAEFAPSNPFDGADEGLLLGTASDVVAEVASKANIFDDSREDIFPQFDEGGKAQKLCCAAWQLLYLRSYRMC